MVPLTSQGSRIRVFPHLMPRARRSARLSVRVQAPVQLVEVWN